MLGLLASDRIEYQKYMPNRSEINATMLAKKAQVAISGIKVKSNGEVVEKSSGSFVNESLRRLGGIVSNRRPVSAFINADNNVSRGFVYGKSIFDRRQLINPPRAFPSLNRPRLVAYLFREIE